MHIQATKREHGNTGNQNASKGHDSVVRFRQPRPYKAAQARGMTLTEWLIEKANAGAEAEGVNITKQPG